ncbi:hypothetical protein BGZ76_011056 [Entomortierella beljakovae]|nr:hypothetical protein BGZ76_011056 [Entomortierella beljakovae]
MGWFSSSSGLPWNEALDVANGYLENGRKCKASSPKSALQFCKDAKGMIYDAEKSFSKVNTTRETRNEAMAKAFNDHANLLDDLNLHDKAQRSRDKAIKWGYSASGTLLIPSPSATSTITKSSVKEFATVQEISSDNKKQLPSAPATTQKDSITVQATNTSSTNMTVNVATNKTMSKNPGVAVYHKKRFFVKPVDVPVQRFPLPETGERFESTAQLAYCLSLLSPKLDSVETLPQAEISWKYTTTSDQDEQDRLYSVSNNLVREFVKDSLKKKDAIEEIVCLAAVLDESNVRALLSRFTDGVNDSLLLQVHLLDGLAQLIKNSPPNSFQSDDLVKILKMLTNRMVNTHSQASENTYKLALAVSRVLDGMVDSQVTGLPREELHEPAMALMQGLRGDSDPCMVFEGAYAYQALLYIGDDESPMQKYMRRTGKVIQGISGVISAAKGLNISEFISGLSDITQGFTGAVNVFQLAVQTYDNVMTLKDSGQGLFDSIKELTSGKKGQWYPALRGLESLIQSGRLDEFEDLILQAPCIKEVAFQWGVCQQLGQLAANSQWDIITRLRAVSFLGDIYMDDTTWGTRPQVKQWVLHILNQLEKAENQKVADQVRTLLKELETNGPPEKQAMFQAHQKEDSNTNQLRVVLAPTTSPLLNIVQDIPDVEAPLRTLRRAKLKDIREKISENSTDDIYIPARGNANPRARGNAHAPGDFDLFDKVQEFISDEEKKVFLIMGDSGAGKSTFVKHLENHLWENYKEGKPDIPLFINLPLIPSPDKDMITKHLNSLTFKEDQIKELKKYHKFILICDGYDEAQLTKNIYMSNRLNQHGDWQGKMIITCRSEYNGADYKDCFQPTDRNNISTKSDEFQEATIMPFNEKQISDYIGKYSLIRNPSTSSSSIEEYSKTIKRIQGLSDLVKNPFLLKLTINILPDLLESESSNDQKVSTITRVELYDTFIKQWLERAGAALRRVEHNSTDKMNIIRLSRSGFPLCGLRYLKDLATEIYKTTKGIPGPIISYKTQSERGGWKKEFFGTTDDGKNLLRQSLPLIGDGSQYQFIHKSILEYGLALAIFDPDVRIDDDYEAEGPSSRCGSIYSFELEEKAAEVRKAVDAELLKSPISERPYVEDHSVMQFLVERAQMHESFRSQLHAIIERSKTEKTARFAAANAITILVRAGIQFNGADLNGIQIPYADLSFGVFDSASLEGADLRRVNLRNVWMRNANLNGAQMDRVQFGEFPYLQESSPVTCTAHWSDDKTSIYAVGLESGEISLYEVSEWKKTHTLIGHTAKINKVLFSKSGDQVATASSDGSLRLWDVRTGQETLAIKDHTGEVISIDYSPSGDKIISASQDGTVGVWSTETGSSIYVLKGHESPVNSAIFSPKGDQIASCGQGNTVILWDVETGRSAHVLNGHGSFISSIVYSPDGEKIASGSGDGTARLWNAVTGSLIYNLAMHEAEVTTVLFSSNGNQLATGSKDHTTRLWDVKTGECRHVLEGHSDGVIGLGYSPNGEQLSSTSLDSTVRLYDIDTGDWIYTFEVNSDLITSVVYSPNGKLLSSGNRDMTVRLWDMEKFNYNHAFQGHHDDVNSVIYLPKQGQIATGGDDKTVRLWDAKTGTCLSNMPGHESQVTVVAHSAKNEQIASGSNDGTVRLWDIDTGKSIYTLKCGESPVYSVTYSPKEDRLASACGSEVHVWDVETGNSVRIFKGHTSEVSSVVFSPKGDQIISSSHDNTAQLWNVETGEIHYTLNGHTDTVNSVAYSPKGDQIATASKDKTIRLWNAETGELIRSLEGHESNIPIIVYSPKGGRLASGCDNTVRLWDVETGECTHVLSGHKQKIGCIIYSPKGDRIATGSHDWTVRIWDSLTGRLQINIQGFNAMINSVAWRDSTEGLFLATASDDKSVRQWKINKDEAILSWSSSHEVLTVSGTSFEGVKDLTPANSTLLHQRNAKVTLK